MATEKQILAAAKEVLKKNDCGTYTIPADGLYPHQWLWDSCFIAIGLRHFDTDRAKIELTSLLRGQWSNGMIPHMVFDNAIAYTQDRNIWRSQLSMYAPDAVRTTGITQPPLLAEAVIKIGEKLPLPEKRTWFSSMLPSLIAYHEWLYRDRDPLQSGLVLQLHPYETGLDSTPPWLDQLHRHHRPWWATLLTKTHLDTAINVFRRDTKHVPPGQRMANIDALLYYDVVRKLRNKQYDTQKILQKSSFAIQDLTFNCIFIRANEALQEIAKAVNVAMPKDLVDNIKLSRRSFEQFWDSYSKQYYSRNQSTNKLIRVPSIATLMPLYAGCITKDHAASLVKLLYREDMFNAAFPIPSVPVGAKEFQPMRYWQGPTWVNTNWLIAEGLERYGYFDEARHIRQTSVDLVDEGGFYEYFNPLDGTPAGAKNFSWTAALVIDTLS